VNNGVWGTDYLNRAATAKSNMYDNRWNETKYIYTDDDSQGQPLEGRNNYAVTFAKGETPPVRGFWSLTLYNEEHFFHENPLNRYSLGTKNKNLNYNADGSLTLYAGTKSPARKRKATGSRRPTARSRSTFAPIGPTRRSSTRLLDAAGDPADKLKAAIDSELSFWPDTDCARSARAESACRGTPPCICTAAEMLGGPSLTRSGHRECIAARANVRFPSAQPGGRFWAVRRGVWTMRMIAFGAVTAAAAGLTVFPPLRRFRPIAS
jgi:hypothetical protein